jgi:Golgi nucleoside diphosphatase
MRLLGWITVNYLKNGFSVDDNIDTRKYSQTLDLEGMDMNQWYRSDKLDLGLQGKELQTHPSTYGLIDIGGASAQIAFEPTILMSQKHHDDLNKIKIRYMSGYERDLGVFVATFLGFGIDQARVRFVDNLFPFGKAGTEKVDPCLPRGLSLDINLDGKPFKLGGSGSFDLCFDAITPLLNKHLTCSENPCLFNGLHAPIEDFRNHRFMGVSNVWYTTFEVYDLGGSYNYDSLSKAAREFCETPWKEISSNVELGIYKNVYNLDSLMLHCFKSVYLLNVLHEGFSFPKNNPQSPALQSSEEINGFSLSWTLGAIFLYASSTIPPIAISRLDSLVNIFLFLTGLLFIFFGLSQIGLFGRYKGVFDLSRLHGQSNQDYVEINLSAVGQNFNRIF